MQVDEIQIQGNCIVLTTMGQAQQWISESKVISKDEMAIAILGTHEIDTSLQFFHANIPCRDAAGRPGILASTICQLGERKIKTTQSQPVVERQCTTVALTVWKEDWSPEDLKLQPTKPFSSSANDLKRNRWVTSLKLVGDDP